MLGKFRKRAEFKSNRFKDFSKKKRIPLSSFYPFFWKSSEKAEAKLMRPRRLRLSARSEIGEILCFRPVRQGKMERNEEISERSKCKVFVFHFHSIFGVVRFGDRGQAAQRNE